MAEGFTGVSSRGRSGIVYFGIPLAVLEVITTCGLFDEGDSGTLYCRICVIFVMTPS